MSIALRIRVLIDTEGEENIFRDIEINGNATFEELHVAIQDAFGFDNTQMASFYESDNNWERGEEIMLMDMSMNPNEPSKLMRDTLVAEILTEAEQKMLYIFDFMLMWTFFVEVVSVEKMDDSKAYPAVLLSVGDAPDQYSKAPEDLFGAMKSEKMDAGLEDDEDDFDLDLDNTFPSY
jgi:hypothetical protein